MNIDLYICIYTYIGFFRNSRPGLGRAVLGNLGWFCFEGNDWFSSLALYHHEITMSGPGVQSNLFFKCTMFAGEAGICVFSMKWCINCCKLYWLHSCSITVNQTTPIGDSDSFFWSGSMWTAVIDTNHVDACHGLKTVSGYMLWSNFFGHWCKDHLVAALHSIMMSINTSFLQDWHMHLVWAGFRILDF